LGEKLISVGLLLVEILISMDPILAKKLISVRCNSGAMQILDI
jgi:hypothetical protein